MVNEGDDVSLWRDARVTDPAVRLIENFIGRELESLAAVYLPHDGHAGTIGRPVSPLDIFENLARSTADERDLRQRSRRQKRIAGMAAERQSHFALRRNGQNVGSGRLQFFGLRTLRPSVVKLQRLSLPGGTVDNSLAVGSKARRVHDAALESEWMIEGERGLAGTREQERANRNSCQQRDSSHP